MFLTMEVERSNPRQKVRHAKVATGCVTCKKRRLKCDEAKPACWKCLHSGNTCKYQPRKTWLFNGSAAPSCSRTSNLDINCFILPSSSLQEHRALMFFLEKTAPVLQGFTSFTGRFWESLVPQLGQSEPSIRHIIVALASRHEMVTSPGQYAHNTSELCLTHHLAAIKRLREISAHSQIVTILVSCLMFVAFENLENTDKTSVSGLPYIIVGLKLLDERASITRTSTNCNFDMIGSLIKPMFSQIKLVLSLFCTPSSGEDGIFRGSRSTRPDLPDSFQDIHSAQRCFFQICRWRYEIPNPENLWSSSSQHFSEIRVLFSQWHNLLVSYRDTLPEENVHERQAVASLLSQDQLFQHALEYSARHDIPESCRTRPYVIDLTRPSEIVVSFKIRSDNLISLSTLNQGRPPMVRNPQVRLWPTGRLIKLPGEHDIVKFTLSA
jgi:hypothetical protein